MNVQRLTSRPPNQHIRIFFFILVAPGLQRDFYVEPNLSYLTSQSAVIAENVDAHSSQVLAVYLAFLHSCAVPGCGC
jgi:hypothetical protein